MIPCTCWHSLKSLKAIFFRLLFLLLFITSCSRLRKTNSSSQVTKNTGSDAVAATVAAALGPKALPGQSAALEDIYNVTTDHPPASVRPDPDVYVRRLLRQFRSEGTVMAREIGRVEEYRMMLGGASQDFRVTPQETYDATALLSQVKVAEEICQGLVDPNSWQHPGWQSVLPAVTSDRTTNLRYLAARIWGVPESKVTAEVIASLSGIMDTAAAASKNASQLSLYVPACVAICVDAEGLLL